MICIQPQLQPTYDPSIECGVIGAIWLANLTERISIKRVFFFLCLHDVVSLTWATPPDSIENEPSVRTLGDRAQRQEFLPLCTWWW